MPGDCLATVSGRPLIALALPYPLYRDLGPGLVGDDVRSVQESLKNLGFYAGAVDGTYGELTSRAVAELYGAVGAEVPKPDPAVESAANSARSALQDAIGAEARAAAQVDAAERTVADASRDVDLAAGEAELRQANLAHDEAADALVAARSSWAAASAALGTRLPMLEVLKVDEGGAIIQSVAPVGTLLEGERGVVAVLRSGTPTVTARVAVDQAGAFAIGDSALATAVGSSDRVGSLSVVDVSSFRQAASGDSVPGYDVTFGFDSAVDVDDGSTLLVTARDSAAPVSGLAVPLVAVREEGSKMFVLRPAQALGAPESIPVTVSVVEDGYALVKSDELHEGDKVIVSD